MSGYFQRLMARGAGTGDEVHPLSRLPFVGLATAEPLGGSGEFTATSHPWDQPQPAGQPERNHTVAEAPAPRPEPPAALLRPPAPQISNAATVEEPAAALAPQIPPLLIQTHASGVETASVRRPPSIMPAVPAREPQTAVPQQAPLERVEEYTVNEMSESFRLMTPHTLANAVTPFGSPPESGGGRVQAAPPGLNNRPSVRTTQNQPSMSAAPEVHVSIGRIEVTAVTAAPVPRRAAIPRKSAMSLDDYLARRQRGEP